jgi:hypothetical protein
MPPRPSAAVDHAEAVAFGISQDHEVGIGWHPLPLHATRAQPDQPLHLGCLVIGIQIKVDFRWHLDIGMPSVQRDIWTYAVRWSQEDEVRITPVARDVVERLGPELDLAVKVVDADDHRTDANHAL